MNKIWWNVKENVTNHSAFRDCLEELDGRPIMLGNGLLLKDQKVTLKYLKDVSHGWKFNLENLGECQPRPES